MPAPNTVSMLLDQHADALLRPCVKVGDSVAIGQVIAKPDVTYSAWLHSPISGVVETVSDQAIVIVNDHQHRVAIAHRPTDDWSELNALELTARLAQGGIVGLGGAGYSTAAKLAVRAEEPIHTLIINGMECEPYITCDDRLMREQAASIITGIKILLQASGASRCIIAIEDDKPAAIEAMTIVLRQSPDKRINLQVLPAAYPNGDEGRLIKLLLNREIPRGQLPASIGVIMHNVASAHACAQWITQGQPLTTRVVTVTGHGVQHPSNVVVCIGTACDELIQYCGGYHDVIDTLIMGGTMMGKSLRNDHDSITKTTNCLIAATERDIVNQKQEQPCIRCGECVIACPAHLLPQQLLLYLRNQNIGAALELGLRDCIECGSCDTVCPSHILLASRFRSAKLSLRS